MNAKLFICLMALMIGVCACDKNEEVVLTNADFCPDGNHPHVVDLGLPSGTKWCCCNVDATKPEEFGGYYAWGETTTKAEYNFITYVNRYEVPFVSELGTPGTKYFFSDLGEDIAGTMYDAAYVRLGAPWRMPSVTQFQELIRCCKRKWCKLNGVEGIRVMGPNGYSLFFPATGYKSDPGLEKAEEGFYWASTHQIENDEICADILRFGSSYWDYSALGRYAGKPIRGCRM